MRAGSRFGLASAPLLLCSVAAAQPTNSARIHFANGVEHAEVGDFDAAAADFEEAYRLSLHHAVLYNLGLAYAAVGKSVEAKRAFEMYLERGGRKIPAPRQEEVRQLISQHTKRIGYVAFEIDPSDATLVIDGHPVSAASPRVPTSLLVGTHGIAVARSSFQPFVASVTVESQKTTSIKVSLEPTPVNPASEATPNRVGQIAIESALPELMVSIDGNAVGRDGNAPFLAPLGPHWLRCERDGYAPFDLRVDILEKGIVRAACDLTPKANLPPSDTETVSFKVDQPDAVVVIDGRLTGPSTRLPRGPHSVQIRRMGFIDWTRTVMARPGFPETIEVRLKPTPEHSQEVARAAEKRRTFAYLIGGTGIALLGTSAALYATNNARYRDWTAQGESSSTHLSTALSIQRQDDAALGVAVVGGVMLGYALISWLGAK